MNKPVSYTHLTEEYRLQSRGGYGIRTLLITEKTGNLSALRLVDQDQDIMIITAEGIVIRMDVATINSQGRSTQGVTLMRLGEDDRVVSVATVSYTHLPFPAGH